MLFIINSFFFFLNANSKNIEGFQSIYILDNIGLVLASWTLERSWALQSMYQLGCFWLQVTENPDAKLS